ncbi:MAG TPA: sialidase family protein [Solirubrobacteraceae bacterium]|nr:sialidase family protein [Solirubrobacteraceae bacterium]
MPRPRLLRGSCLTVAVATLAGCGSAAHETSATAPPSAVKSTPLVDAGRPPYITALAVDPADRSLLLATNRGLYRIDAEGRHARPIAAQARAEGREGPFGQRVSSLAFVGGRELLGSGHPNGTAGGLPPFLGVIESLDGGRRWSAIARAGMSDLHVLVASGAAVYGFDTVLGGVVASSDEGRSFAERLAPPGEALVLDMAIDPHEHRHLLASTLTAIFSSPDGGNTWRRIAAGAEAHLAWMAPGLYRADADRSVQASTDGGATWRRVGSLPRTPGKLVELPDGTLYAALIDGSIVSSRDGGHSWKGLFAP